MAFDEAGALAAGYSPEEVAVEKTRRAKEYAAAQEAKFAAKVKAGGGMAGDENFFDNLHTGVGKALSDTGLGAQQFANWATRGLIGNKEELNKEAAEREQRDKALMRTGGGIVGKVGTDIATSFLPMGIAAKAIKGAGMVPSLARAAAGGAAGNLFTPDEDYSALKQAGVGAAFGAGGDLVGRGAARLWAPFRNKGASAAAAENAETLNRAGLPNQIPATQTDNGAVQAMTNALEQVPGAGHWVRKARGENAAWGTGKFTGESGGAAVSDLSQSARDRLKKEANDALNVFRSGPDVSTGAMPPRLQALADQLVDTPAIKPKASLIKRVGELESELKPVHTADQMMNLRNEAGEMAQGGATYLERKTGRELKEFIEDAIKSTPGVDAAKFDTALKQYGGMKDVTRAAGDLGEHLVGGRLTPERMVAGSASHTGMFPERDKLVSAMAGNMPSPPKQWNRALLTSLLLGGTGVGMFGGGYLSSKALDDPTLGSATAPALAASLIAGLSRKAPSQAQIDAIIKLLTATGQGAGKQF